MTPKTPAAGRLVRPAAVLVLLALAALLGVAPAGAAGTGGVELSPYPGVVDGKQVAAFHATVPSSGDTKVRYSLRNTTARPASARLFAASAARDSSGRFTIGEAGSSAYLGFADQQVTLAPRETRIASFTVHPGPGGSPKGTAYGALVVEVRNGSIVQRAATVVYLRPGRQVPLPLLVVLVAVGVLVVAGTGIAVTARRR